MQIVIDIPQGLKMDFENENWTALTCMEMKNALMNGTQLPKGHGDLIDRYNLLDNAGRYNYKNFQMITVARIMAEDAVVPADKEDD